MLNQRKQEEGELVNDIVTALYCLSDHCQYAKLRDEMIRDRIVVRLRDSIFPRNCSSKQTSLEKVVTSAHSKSP